LSKDGVTAASVGGLAGGFKVTFGGLLVSCNHSGVVEKRVRLVAGGSFCCVGVVSGGYVRGCYRVGGEVRSAVSAVYFG
jgi:hypothetical protein